MAIRSKNIQKIIDEHAPGREVINVIVGKYSLDSRSNLVRWLNRHNLEIYDVDVIVGPRAGSSWRDGHYLIICKPDKRYTPQAVLNLKEECFRYGICLNRKEASTYGVQG